MTIVEGVGEVSEERGIQETLLHVAVRVGCVDLAVFFMGKGTRVQMDLTGLKILEFLFVAKLTFSLLLP